MRLNRELVDTIKLNFASKSLAQLQAIVQADSHEHWSPEAITAAGEVLQDRLAGLAQEPAEPEEECPPPPARSDQWSLAFGAIAIFYGLTGYLVMPRIRFAAADDPDLPVPFGPRMAWLAVDSRDTEAVASSLGLLDAQTATWADGINAAHRTAVYVTPPVGCWTLAVGAALFPPVRPDAFVTPLLERLSRQFGDVQYFCTNTDVEMHVWARARKGRLVRGFGWLGDKSLTLWNEGPLTPEEHDLAFRFADVQSFTTERNRGTVPGRPDESCVMQVASLWSIDPTTLDREYKELVMGLVGNISLNVHLTRETSGSLDSRLAIQTRRGKSQ